MNDFAILKTSQNSASWAVFQTVVVTRRMSIHEVTEEDIETSKGIVMSIGK